MNTTTRSPNTYRVGLPTLTEHKHEKPLITTPDVVCPRQRALIVRQRHSQFDSGFGHLFKAEKILITECTHQEDTTRNASL